MRVWGWVLLVLGAFFLAAFALAAAGGGQVGILPWIIVGFLTLTGINFIRSGKGIVRADPAPTTTDAATALGAPSAASTAPLTVEIPMSPAAATAIARGSRLRLMVPVYLGLGFFLFWLLVGTATAIIDHAPGEGAGLFVIFAVVGAATAVLIIGISWLSARGAFADARGTTCLRTTGPLEVVQAGPMGGTLLRLADRAFLINTRKEAKALRTLAQGTVEYSPRGHVIVAAWDPSGHIVYAAPGYEPSPT